jgi:hypothetical protein
MLDYDTQALRSREYFEHGYKHTEVTLMHGRLTDVRALLAGTWNNRAGYGTEEAAERLGERYRSYLARGILSIFEPGIYAPFMRVTFQHMPAAYVAEREGNAAYCEPNYYIGERLDSLTRSAPLLAKCRGKRTRAGKWVPAVETPSDLIARFPKAVVIVETERDAWSQTRDYYIPTIENLRSSDYSLTA